MTLEVTGPRVWMKKCTKKIKVMKLGPLFVFFPGRLNSPVHPCRVARKMWVHRARLKRGKRGQERKVRGMSFQIYKSYTYLTNESRVLVRANGMRRGLGFREG